MIFEKRFLSREGKNAIEPHVSVEFVGPPKIGEPPFEAKHEATVKLSVLSFFQVF